MNPTDALAVYRITRLITEDTITEPLRDRVIRWANKRVADSYARQGRHGYVPESKLAELVGCPHCVGVWAAGAVVVARRAAPRLWGPVATMLALSAVTSLEAVLEESLESLTEAAWEAADEEPEPVSGISVNGG